MTQSEWYSAKAVIERLVKVVPASQWPWLLETYFKEDSTGLCVYFELFVRTTWARLRERL